MIYLIHGAPASGKSTLAKALSKEFTIPNISRDEYAEVLYEAFDSQPEGFVQGVYDLGLKILCDLANGNCKFIWEGTLNLNGTYDFLDKKIRNFPHAFQEIFLHAPMDLLVERYKHRAFNGRHDCHNDKQRYKKLKLHLEETTYKPIGFNRTITFNSSEVSTEEMVVQIKELEHYLQ